MHTKVASYELIDDLPLRQTMVLSADIVSSNWHIFRPLLEPLEHQDPLLFLPEDVLPLMRRGVLQLWAGNDEFKIFAVMLTTVIAYPRWKVCSILWVSGQKVLKMMPLLESIEDWALQQGCDAMNVSGRRGWQRVLWPYGYRMNGMQLEKRLRKPTEH